MGPRPKTEENEPDTVLSEAAAGFREAVDVFRVLVVEVPDQGLSVTLDGSQPSRVLAGKGPACALRLTDPQVSRRHAALDLAEGQLRLLDLESTTGTFVNGVRVMDALLRGGEVVGIGCDTLRVEALGECSVAPVPKRGFGKVVGASLEMRRLYPLCERIALSDAPVLIQGETGTGREALAESLHEEGARAGGPFVVFDCTVPDTERGTMIANDGLAHARANGVPRGPAWRRPHYAGKASRRSRSSSSCTWAPQSSA